MKISPLLILLNNDLKYNKLKVIQTTTDKPKRNYGLDLLRIFSMINIINLHINLRLGLYKLNPNNIKFKSLWCLETFSFFAVDSFGLISGIVNFNKYKFSNLIYLWFIYAFYCIMKRTYQLIYEKRINSNKLLLYFFPILNKFHWYVNAYFIMYLFLPFINFGIKLLNMKTFRNLVFFYILFFSIYFKNSVFFFGNSSYNFLLEGYSSSWLVILYIIGSYFGKYILKTSNKLNILSKSFYLINYIGFSFLSSEIFFITGNRFLISYISPTILFQALSLVMIFNSINIENRKIIKILKFITPLTFSVTLIHSILFSFKPKIVLSTFESIRKFNNKFLFFKIYIVSVFIFILCIIIDFFRLSLFKMLKIREISIFIEIIFPKIFDKFL